MDFERWAKGDSLLHRASPQLKIAGAICFCFALASCSQVPAVLIGLFVACCGVMLAGIPLMLLGKRLLVINVFTLVCWLTLPVTVHGTTVAHWFFFSVSAEGLALALLITLKTNSLVLAFVVLIGTSTVADLGHGLRLLKIPRKLCLLLLFSYRYIFVIYDEYRRLKRAAMLRSFRPVSSMHTYQTYGNLFGMTLVKGWKRARRVQDAMVLRGFSGEFMALNYAKTAWPDWMLFGVVLCCTGVVLIFEYRGVV